ncbi:ATP-binding cassette domain-containing protein [Oscillospiraceae bacterium HV4-5-C5C]|nr:ATP-binding cassette domain-containing protein [Oscillospiraceae bacterium HV4-5-C5C]
MLQLQHVNKVYQSGTPNSSVLFNDFNLEVESGQFVSVVGSNGSGKTSMLNLICGSISLDSGRVLLDGKDISHLAENRRARWIGRVFQDPARGTCPHLSITENLAIAENKFKPFNFRRLLDRECHSRYQALLEPLGMGLEKRMDQPCGTLSGGQRQALALLMTALNPPDLLILDEHTAALDPKSSERIMQLTAEIVEQHHLTTLMVTHNLRFALNYGNRLLMMHEGTIIRDNAAEEKQQLQLDTLLNQFNQISIEYGN